MLPTVVVFGATGNQGRAVSKHLVKSGQFLVRSVSRNPQASVHGELWVADMADDTALRRLMKDASAVFCVHPEVWNDPEAGIREQNNVCRVIEHAAKAGIKHFIYSSSIGSELPLLHDNYKYKLAIEVKLKSASSMNYTILRPVFFMENFIFCWEETKKTGKFSHEYPPDFMVDLIAAEDVGRLVQKICLQERFYGKTMDVASETRSMADCCKLLSERVQLPIEYFEKTPSFPTLDLADLNCKVNGLTAVIKGTSFSEWLKNQSIQ